jgi:hypothetical protein
METAAENALDACLHSWEDYSFLLEAQSKIVGRYISGYGDSVDQLKLLTNWRRFRLALLNNRIESLNPIEWMPILSPHLAHIYRDWGGVSMLGTVPLEYFAWTRRSRRIFSIPAYEQRLFAQSTFPNFTWSEIMWPFESFGIELGEPITVPLQSPYPYVVDELLVSHVWFGDERTICVRLLQNKGEAIFSGKERDKAERLMRTHKYRQAGALLDRAVERHSLPWHAAGSLCFVLSTSRQKEDSLIMLDEDGVNERINGGDDGLLSRVLRKTTPEVRAVLVQMARIVVGTCVYLESISHASPPTWEKKHGSGRKTLGPLGIITNERLVCKIIGRSVIDPSAYEAYSLELPGQGFVRPHWRRRHLRRPIGTPPDYPKTIMIPPKLINAAYVPLFGILAGSISRVLSDELEWKGKSQ